MHKLSMYTPPRVAQMHKLSMYTLPRVAQMYTLSDHAPAGMARLSTLVFNEQSVDDVPRAGPSAESVPDPTSDTPDPPAGDLYIEEGRVAFKLGA
jgi:hypothetical protein